MDAPSIHDFAEEHLAEFPTTVRGYLLSWHLVFDSFSTASFKVRNDYTLTLKSEKYIAPLLGFISDVLGHSTANALNLDKERFDSSFIRSYDLKEAETEREERNMQWLLVHLYYLCLKFTPQLVKDWWIDCPSKQTRIAIESWTAKHFSPMVIQDALDEVSQWAENQEETEDEKALMVKISTKSREIYAGYEVDETAIQIVIRLRENYPLDGVKVEGVNRVAVSEKKFQNWQVNTQGVITFSVCFLAFHLIS